MLKGSLASHRSEFPGTASTCPLRGRFNYFLRQVLSNSLQAVRAVSPSPPWVNREYLLRCNNSWPRTGNTTWFPFERVLGSLLAIGECLIALFSLIDSYFAIILNTDCWKQVSFFFLMKKIGTPNVGSFWNFNMRGKLRRVLKETLISIFPKCYCSRSHLFQTLSQTHYAVTDQCTIDRE